MSFKEARKVVRKYNFDSARELKIYKNKHPGTELDNIYASPDGYKKEWTNWNDFLGSSWARKGLKYRKKK